MASGWNARVLMVTCHLFLVMAVATAIGDHRTSDFRVTTMEDLVSSASVQIYSNPDVSDYKHLLVDTSRNQLILGARDYLLRLDLVSLRPIEVVEWKATNATVASCLAKGQSSENCHNFLRVLVAHKEFVFACGTNAFSPQCSWREAGSLSTVQEWVTGVARCPYHPAHNSSALMTASGDLYSGAMTDFSARDPAIYRIMGPAKILRTIQHNSRWLNEPNFVSTYEIGDFVYFFFRETAIEYINCGKTVYTRVARICKSDNGGNFLLEDNWTTFTKARLNCSLPGDYPFYFSELQATHYDEDSRVFYAVFTTAPTSMYGSAVCAYNMSALERAFSGPYKYQESVQMAWNKVPNAVPNLQCPAENTKRSLAQNHTPAQRLLVDAQKFQMMDTAIQPLHRRPLVVAVNDRFTHIAVDRTPVKNHDRPMTVFFLATLEGAVRKMVSLPNSSTPCLLEEVLLAAAGETTVVRSMKLIADQGVIVIGTRDKVLRIPVERCDRFRSKLACLNSQDPYCGWNEPHRKCARLPSSPTAGWLQDIHTCPILNSPVVGGWSAWSQWSVCVHKGARRPGNKCVCRSRSCDSPQPRYGGDRCVGISVEVANCTQDGGWTPWSEWSACTATCGAGTRARHRHCANPRPQFGGRRCDGNEAESEYCDALPVCPDAILVAPHGGGRWSTWSPWSDCTSPCAGGVQVRRRLCNTPVGRIGACVGNDQQWKTCNHHRCPEVRRVTPWSAWRRANVSKSGYTEERTRHVCRASVTDASLLRVGATKIDVRFCSDSGTDCVHPGVADAVLEVDGQWSSWSGWSECTAPCGGGRQWRERACTEPTPSGGGRDCHGVTEEARSCHQHSCHGSWSCWSDFSHCSVSCGYGRKIRTRRCRPETPGAIYTETCIGSSRDEVACETTSCDGGSGGRSRGWGKWTVWSQCSRAGVQERRRGCRLPYPCHGPDHDRRLCDYGIGPLPSAVLDGPQRSRQAPPGGFHAYHVAVAAALGFLLGGAVCVAASLYWRRRVAGAGAAAAVGAKRRPMSTLPRHEATENEYACPSELDAKGAYRPLAGLDSRCYAGGGSLGRAAALTVREATLKRSSLMAGGGTLMRTKLELCDDDY